MYYDPGITTESSETKHFISTGSLPVISIIFVNMVKQNSLIKQLFYNANYLNNNTEPKNTNSLLVTTNIKKGL